MAEIRILCVDPPGSGRREWIDGLRTNLPDLEPDVEARDTVAAAEDVLEDRPVDCVVTEYDLPDGTGLELIDRGRTLDPNAAGILYTAVEYDEIDTAEFETTVVEYLARDTPGAVSRLADLVRTTVTRRSQSSYPRPRDELERIGALESYDFDSGGLRDSLERLTDVVAHYFDPVGVEINVIGDRTQTTLAAYGPADSGASTAREESICTFTILEDDGVLAVEDVRDDPRFRTSADEFEDRGVRSYVGSTLVAPGGHVLGTVCVYDREQRTFTPGDEAFLRDVAGVAMDLIEANSRGRAGNGGAAAEDGGGSP